MAAPRKLLAVPLVAVAMAVSPAVADARVQACAEGLWETWGRGACIKAARKFVGFVERKARVRVENVYCQRRPPAPWQCAADARRGRTLLFAQGKVDGKRVTFTLRFR